MGLIKGNGPCVFLNGPQVIRIMGLLGKFNELCANPLALKKMVHIELFDLGALDVDQAFYNAVVIDIDVVQNLRFCVVFRYFLDLQSVERMVVIPENRAEVDPLVEDQDFRNAGEVGGGCFAYFFSGCVHDLTSGTFIDRFYRRYEEKSRLYLGLDVTKIRSPFSTKNPLHICTTFSTKSVCHLLTFLCTADRMGSNKGN